MKTSLRIALSVLVAAALVALLLEFTGTTPEAIATALRQLDPRVYWTALAVQAAIYPLRALRFKILLPTSPRPPLARLVPVTAAHILAAYVLPVKVGEASLVPYLRRATGLRAPRALAVLLVTRLLDFAAVAGLLALACLTLGLAGRYPASPWLTPLGAVLLAPTLVFLWLGLRSERLVALAVGALGLAGLDRSGPGRRLADFSRRVGGALAEVSRRDLILGALATLPIWLCVFLFFGVLARGFGMVDLSFAAATFGAGLAILANLLPVNGFAGFGVQDLGWVAGFGALGVPPELAVSSGISAHLVYLFNIALFGLLGHLALGLLPRAARPGEAEGGA